VRLTKRGTESIIRKKREEWWGVIGCDREMFGEAYIFKEKDGPIEKE